MPLPDSIVESKLWPELREYIQIQLYDRDGSTVDPRVRIEFLPMPPELQRRALALRVKCCRCGSPIFPVRRRGEAQRGQSAQHLYFAAACPLDVNVGCSRGNDAREEYKRVRAEAEKHGRPSRQLGLFGRRR
jgi:hypothetical protein